MKAMVNIPNTALKEDKDGALALPEMIEMNGKFVFVQDENNYIGECGIDFDMYDYVVPIEGNTDAYSFKKEWVIIMTPVAIRTKLKELFDCNKSTLDDLFFNLIQDAINGTDKELLEFIEDYQETTLQYHGWVLIDTNEICKDVPTLLLGDNLQAEALELLVRTFPDAKVVCENSHAGQFSVSYTDGRYAFCGFANGDLECDAYDYIEMMEDGELPSEQFKIAHVADPGEAPEPSESSDQMKETVFNGHDLEVVLTSDLSLCTYNSFRIWVDEEEVIDHSKLKVVIYQDEECLKPIMTPKSTEQSEEKVKKNTSKEELEALYLGKPFGVHFEYYNPGEVHFHTVQEIKIEDHGVELWDNDTSVYVSLEHYLENPLGDLPKATHLTPEAIQANLSENGMAYRVGNIVEILDDGADEEHYTFLSRFHGETYVVGEVELKRKIYYLIPLVRYEKSTHSHPEMFVKSEEDNGARVIFTDDDLIIGQPIENTNDENRDLEDEVKTYLSEVFLKLGIDRPSNYDEIHKFIVDDVADAADPIAYHSGDMDIAFRRFLEKEA